MPGSAIVEALEIHGNSCRTMEVHVCEDLPIHVYLNGVLAGSFEACPVDLRDLVCGFFIGEGLIATAGDLESINVRGSVVTATSRIEGGCARQPALSDRFRVDARVLFERYCAMDDYSPLRMQTWGNHSAAIFTAAGGLVAFAEDAQRQGCICKAIGKAAYAGYNPGECFLMSTGRASPWIIRAVRNAGMPLIVCFGVPSAKAVESARDSGITLVTMDGLARVIIFARAERITGLPDEMPWRLSEMGMVNYR